MKLLDVPLGFLFNFHESRLIQGNADETTCRIAGGRAARFGEVLSSALLGGLYPLLVHTLRARRWREVGFEISNGL
jgi:hypothetical protein